MKRRSALVFVVAALGIGASSGFAQAAQPPLEEAGQPFYFSATCTDIGDVIFVNQSLAFTAALRVVGAQTVVLVPFGNFEHARVVQNSTATCTFTGGGFSIDAIEPFEPVEVPVVIINP
jgi:hypothetical protein